jgi:CHAT domain-containing protein/tetratricopeptide (TPR) repeat protein
MSSPLNHLLYVDEVRDLNSSFRKLSHEGGKDVSAIAEKAVDLATRFLIENSYEFLEAFSNQSTVYFTKSDFESSKALLSKMVERIDVDLLGDEEKRIYSTILNNLGVCYFSLENYNSAAKYLSRSFQLKKRLKYHYHDLIGLVEDLAESYIQIKALEKARICWTELTDIAAEEFGKSSYDYLDSLGDLFNFYKDNGFDAEAENLDNIYSELETRLNSALLSGKDYDRAVVEAKKLYSLGEFEKARNIHEQILAGTPKLPGILDMTSILGHTMDPLALYASELDDKAYGLQKKKEFPQAIQLYTESVEILRTSLGKSNIRLAFALSNLGDAKIDSGDLDGAKVALSACLDIVNLPLNRENENRMKMVENYARVIYTKSLKYAPELDSANAVSEQYEKRNAPEDYARSIRIRMLLPDENETPIENMIRNFEAREAFYESIGNYPVVLQLLEDVAELNTVYYVFEPEKAIDAKLKLANAHVYHRNLEVAEKIFQSALAMIQANLSSDNPYYIYVLYTIGIFYAEIGDYKTARKYLEKSLGLSQQLSPRVPEMEHQLKIDLISVYHRGHQEEGNVLMKELLKDFDANELTDPIQIQTFASYHSQLMQLDKAEPLYKKAIAILKEDKGEWDLDYALALSNLANTYRFQLKFQEALALYKQSLRIRETELGRNHPKLTPSLTRLALTYAALGDAKYAVETIDRLIEIEDDLIEQMFGFGSPDQKMGIVKAIDSSTDLCLSIFLHFNHEMPELAMKGLILAQKRKAILGGMLLDKDLEAVETADKVKISAELKELKRSISSSVKGMDPSMVELAIERIAFLEKRLNNKSFIFNDSEIHQRLTKAIDDTTAGLEVLQISNFQFNANLLAGEPETLEQYIGFLIIGNPKLEVRIINFGSVETINEDIRAIRDQIKTKKDTVSLSVSLGNKLIKPILSQIDKVKQLLICPDGDLSLLPFDLLYYRGHPLVDNYLVRKAEKISNAHISGPEIKNGESIVIAAPDYFAFSLNDTNNQPISFVPLEGAFNEGQEVSQITGGRLISGQDATKIALEEINSPAILHIATHAFYGKNFPGFEEMPLLKSGLALAGANNSSKGQNGIISAEEISLLYMTGTELVVLSACDTARGETFGKEGVFGLEKAFRSAGAKRIIVSLWEVPDMATNKLMVAFYKYLYQGNDVTLSLTMAKRDLKEICPEPLYWSAFVLNGNGNSFTLPRK